MSTELERIGIVLFNLFFHFKNHFAPIFIILFFFLFLARRGDKKAICNKFVQTVSKEKLRFNHIYVQNVKSVSA